LKSKIENIIP
jgi:hypothetical protein